jgi:hypothetical protein
MRLKVVLTGITLMTLLTGQGVARAQFANLDLASPAQQQAIQALGTFAGGDVSARGGGSSGKALGDYLAQPPVVYTSAYKDVDGKTMAQWAYILHVFMDEKGVTAQAARASGKVNDDYDEIKKFAEGWWGQRKEYKDVPFMYKDAFLKEAIMDGFNLYTQQYAKSQEPGADYAAWSAAVLDAFAKQGAEKKDSEPMAVGSDPVSQFAAPFLKNPILGVGALVVLFALVALIGRGAKKEEK